MPVEDAVELTPTTCEVTVERSDPQEGAGPRMQKFQVPRSADTSILDALLYISGKVDASLSVSHSCGKQRCGSCAMKIDGKIALACYTPVKDRQTVSPLPGFRVVKDLVVDWRPYEGRMYDLVPKGPDLAGAVEPEERDGALARSAMTCIKCFSCVGACPTVDLKGSTGFAGPAISVMLATYLDDGERQSGLTDSVLKGKLEFCTKCYACNSVCPADIDIVASINRLQRVSAKRDVRGRDLLEMIQGRL